MYKKRTVMAVIPARSGSKGLPGKNIKVLCGKPLIVWSISNGLKSKFIDEVMVTTDSEDIAIIAQENGASVPFLRPSKLARDDSSTMDVVRHVVEFYKKNKNKTFDYTVLMEPTSPLREADDIDNMLIKLINNEVKYDSIISIGEVHEHPVYMKKINNNLLEPFCRDLKAGPRRQDNEPAYFPYGVAYIVKTSSLLKENTFYTERCTYYKIKRYQNFEIDDIYDFMATENIMKYKLGVR